MARLVEGDTGVELVSEDMFLRLAEFSRRRVQNIDKRKTA